ncbi:lysophospholipid acyltransferase family protein [Granulosicoccus antarcticus]|uniref:1-acyl-sn-glycerol-3-phosphate acyltransferase n=1 Tax=Granulosicoccus antarcticus IMCC3135 TaxID=1192854 RepID=A0A2Z2NQU2_9GAMM|nr:lysophospholipid acyltransferase family protein [Granulosicoccus antarcticus]ASJ71100.1 1-acyl-sn-glycerol-3-phosphate acyltransferase [Granulosicoccus antarcticus IMCC3135]
MSRFRKALAWFAANAILIFARLVTAVHAKWLGSEPRDIQRVYFANHCSHGDFVLLWTVLPPALRRRTRPVAGADYWLRSSLRRFIGCDVFHSVLIERNVANRDSNPVAQMVEALDNGDSLIVFPEGTRNTGESRLLPFKSGLFHLASARADVQLVPVWINNLNRVLPKGEIIPVPLICSVSFGPPLELVGGESKNEFLARAEGSLLALAAAESGVNGGQS